MPVYVSCTNEKNLGGIDMNYAIWVTTSCNLQCKYCYEGDNKPNLMMNREKADDILRYIEKDLDGNEDSDLIIDFHGGEPFLNFKIMKYLIEQFIMKYSRQRKVIFGTTTNATIMNDEILDFICKFIPDITVSLDGTKTDHDYLRPYRDGRGSYDISIRNSLRILHNIPMLRVRMTVTPDNIATLSEGIISLIKYGFKIIVPVIDQFDKRWNDAFIEQLGYQIQSVKDYLDNRSEVAVSLCEPIFIKSSAICSGGKSSKNIYADGSIYPCMMAGGVPEFRIGDIYTGVNTERLENILSYNKQSFEECNDCALSNACNGNRCKIINRLVTGKYNNPPKVECELNHLLYKINGVKL